MLWAHCLLPRMHSGRSCLSTSSSHQGLFNPPLCYWFMLNLMGLQQWKGAFWEPVALFSLGLCVHLGHNVAACSAPVIFKSPLVVYHINGAHFVQVLFCGCNESPRGYLYPNQLLRSSWFPASLTHPRTAFTFTVLKHFHLLTLQSKTTAYDFYNSLVHETDNTAMEQTNQSLEISVKNPPRCSQGFQSLTTWN